MFQHLEARYMPHRPTPLTHGPDSHPAKLVRNLLNQVITDASGNKWPLRWTCWTSHKPL
jgi:hypothetical protein